MLESHRAANNPGLRKTSATALLLVLSLAALVFPNPLGAAVDAEQPRVMRAIRIQLPITGQTVDRVRQFVRRTVDRAAEEGKRLTLLFEFEVPPKQAEFGRGSEFGAALDLARLLTSKELQGVYTVAYVPNSIQGHAVLAVLACEEIMMAKEAGIGMAGCDEETITAAMRSHYKETADLRKTIPAAVVLWMLDPSLEVLAVDVGVTEYILADELPALRKKHTIRSQRKLYDADNPHLSLVAERGMISGNEARTLTFIKRLAASRHEVAKALGFPPEQAEENPVFVGAVRPVRVDVKGPISPRQASKIRRLLQEEVRQRDANFVCLWIDSPGGSLEGSLSLARAIAELDSTGRISTVAYVPTQALSDAALIALACKEVAIDNEAVLGGPGAREFTAEEIADARQAIGDPNGPFKHRPRWLVAAIVDPQLVVYQCSRPGEEVFLTAEEFQRYLRQHPDARKGEPVTVRGQQFKAVGQQAVRYGLASNVFDSFAQFRQYYGIGELDLLEPGWASFLVEVLASPGVAAFLLMIGFVALYIELHTPGIGIGGFVSFVCFALFFWSHYLGGTAGWLEVVLFATGVACLLLEMFVLPGFGIFGLGGGLLVIASLILASQTFVVPHNPYQFAQLQKSLLTIGGAGVGFVAAAMALRKWLPKAPVLSQMFLAPPEGEEAERIRRREVLADYSDLLGSTGITTTQLTPSGKARFGSRLVDVVSDGDLIPRNAQVRVVAVYGNRVVVKQIDES